MFLYDNNIVSESYLTVEAEPVVDFYTEAMECNKALLTESMGATKYMMDVISEYGNDRHVVTEAFSEWKDKIIKFLKEFKAKVIVLFRRWIDWIAKKLHMKGRYSDEAVEKLLADNSKCAALAGFKMELAEPTDFGYTYFTELQSASYPKALNNLADSVHKARSVKDGDKNEYDAQKLRDKMANETQSFLSGNKITEVGIDDLRNLFDFKKNGAKNLKRYEETTLKSIEQITKSAQIIGNFKDSMVEDKNAYMYLVTVASCLGDHLTKMSNEYATYINRIDQVTHSFLPQAEQYLLAQ